MYHPMLSFAVAQTRIDDLTRAGRNRRLTRVATRRTRPSTD
jgi:hypothetical protein